MIPVQFKEANTILALTQDEYEPMHAHKTDDGRMICCFRLSPAELEEIAKTRTLWIQQLNFDQPFQPIGLSTQSPFKSE